MPIGDLLAQITGEEPRPQPSPNAPSKRKADADLIQRSEKVYKRTEGEDRPLSRVARLQKSQALGISPSAVNPMTSAPSRNMQTKPIPKSSTHAPVPVTAPATAPAKPPKKGSYAEIMARGKAAQSILSQMGKIQHKPIDKTIGKKERLESKGQKAHDHRASERKPSSIGAKAVPHEKNGTQVVNTKKFKERPVSHEEKKVKKAATATTGYTGTARPIVSLSKSSRLPSQSRASNSGSRDRHPAAQSSSRYTYASEDNEGAEEDYYSDASSDMEAAAYEVDEEEEYALRMARQEDAKALKEENQHKREKEEKRRRLLELARARR